MEDNKKEPTFYEILGISEASTLAEIKTAYRKKVMEYHPDVNPNVNTKECHEMMCKINTAYEILRDSSTRMEYDMSISENEIQSEDSHNDTEEESEPTSTNQKQYTKTKTHSYDSSIYEYYDSVDYDYYNQVDFTEFIHEYYQYHEGFYEVCGFELSKEEQSILEKLISFLERILDIENDKIHTNTNVKRKNR